MASRSPRSTRSPSAAGMRNMASWCGRRLRSIFRFADLAVEQFAGPIEGSQSDHPLRRPLARRRRRGGDGGRGVHLDQRLSAPRELCDWRSRLRSVSLVDRPHAARQGRRSPGVDRLDLARPCSAQDRPSHDRARHAGTEARQGACKCSFPSARPGSTMPGASFASTMWCRCRSRISAAPICRRPPTSSPR